MRLTDLRFAERVSPRRLGFAVLTLPLIGFVLTVVAFDLLAQHYSSAAQWVEHTLEVGARLNSLQDGLLDAETGVRSYLFTGDESYLEPYDVAQDSLPATLEGLKALTMDNPRQRDQLAEIEPRVSRELDRFGALIAARAAGTLDPADQRAALLETKSDMDALRAAVQTMQAEEQHLLEERQARADRLERLWLAVIGASALFGLLGLVAALALFELLFRQAQDAIRAREEFVSVAAHELKTPLTSLRGYSDLALRRLRRGDGLTPEQVQRTLEIVSKQADKQTRLVNQLLDLSRIESHRLRLDCAPTDLTRLVAEAVEAVQSTTTEHRLVLQAPGPVEVVLDPLRVEQVLVNLLTNAVKYSPDGGQIDVLVTDPRSGAVEVAVRDRGLGIPPDRREHIFERFYRAHSDGSASGLGLGLFVSRQIVELHDGELRAEFPADGGTRFVMRLPASAPESASEVQVATA